MVDLKDNELYKLLYYKFSLYLYIKNKTTILMEKKDNRIDFLIKTLVK